LRFLEAAHVKDVLALLRWTRNPRDRVSGFRAIQLVASIGPKTAARVLDHVMSRRVPKTRGLNSSRWSRRLVCPSRLASPEVSPTLFY
jgi:superfamily I DNA/RNA helicase